MAPFFYYTVLQVNLHVRIYLVLAVIHNLFSVAGGYFYRFI
jgi:hypothetical protein